MAFLASIQFYQLFSITTKKENELLPNDAPTTIFKANVAKTNAPFSFSACLIIKDDNIILPEWLAYHYTVLPLGRLIVGVDTMSHTDPSPILEAYQAMGINITTWKNDSFWKDGTHSWTKKEFAIANNTSYDILLWRYLHRQNVFYEACLQQLHNENRTWTVMIDADEYLAFNYYDDSEKISSSDYNVSNTRSRLNQSPPDTMADVVSNWDIDPNLPCVTFARYLFVSTETEVDDSKEVPHQVVVHPEFNATLFHTLRYRQRAPLNSMLQPGKSIVDASRYDGSPITNPHKIKSLCTEYSAWPDNKDMPFRVHHYVGSWETFRSPGFDIRSRSRFDQRNNLKNTPVKDNTMSAWLNKFAALVGGVDKVIELTQSLRLREELEMERKIVEQQQQRQYDWENINTNTKLSTGARNGAKNLPKTNHLIPGGEAKRTELPKPDEQCAFCKGGIPIPDMIVPQTGGNTCSSIKLLAVKEYKRTDACKIIQKEENVCCSEPESNLALNESPSPNNHLRTKENQECTFCEGKADIIPSLDLVVPNTGGNTCRSIKSMAAREVIGSTICATLKKEERVCCPVVDSPQNTRINNVCHDINSLRDTTKWPDIIFFEDHPNYAKPANPDPNRKENMVARATVAEFNRIRNAVLRPTLLDAGIKEGSLYAAQSFAQRFLERKDNSRPLSVAVTGNSFTIGSLCGETDRQGSAACAWPNRLAQRWKEIVTTTFGNSVNSEIEWHMLQQNAQGSNNVMHRLPSLIDEHQSKNKTLDLLLLNNGISDRKGRYGDMGAWFEAVVRVVLEHFPQIVIISIVDGIPEFLDDFNAHAQGFLRSFITTQEHYNLTRIDFAKMCRILRDSDEENYAALRHQYPQSSLLWPQVSTFMYANGTALTEEVSGFRHKNLHLYWANYTPRLEKTKIAYYPTNHPPWTTHQYVADSVLYTLLSLLNSGMGCDGAGSTIQRETEPPLPEATVADKAEVERCSACLKPSDQLDARTHQVVVNATGTNSSDKSPVVVTCGDWKWVTDERKRSGWQSDQAGSLIRFRLKVSGIPFISLTYMTSHATFGSFRVTFQPISKANNTTQLMGCNQTPFPFPSMRLKGKRQQFSLWDTFIFSGKLDSNYGMANKVMKKTVLEMIDQSKDVEYIDMYVLNDNYDGNETRVKIQTVTSCSFHPDKRTELPKPDEQCAFCKGGIPTPDMIVPQTGGNTCASIKLLAVKEYNGTDICEILLKQESVCCSESEQSTHLALKAPAGNARSEEDVIVDIAANRGGNTTVILNATSNWTTKDANYSFSTS